MRSLLLGLLAAGLLAGSATAQEARKDPLAEWLDQGYAIRHVLPQTLSDDGFVGTMFLERDERVVWCAVRISPRAQRSECRVLNPEP
jgi:hypothetical protein